MRTRLCAQRTAGVLAFSRHIGFCRAAGRTAGVKLAPNDIQSTFFNGQPFTAATHPTSNSR